MRPLSCARVLLPLAALFISSLKLVAADDPLQYTFTGRYGQVEVGGPFAGAEFHESRPLPSRISFYYPVANSLDLSTDYWKRGDSRPFALGLRVGSGERRWIGRDGWDYTLSPYRVEFNAKEEGLDLSASYDFCLKNPAMVLSVDVKNPGSKTTTAEIYLHIKGRLRTCQTYAVVETAAVEYLPPSSAVLFQYDSEGADSATLFLVNAGVQPERWTTRSSAIGASDSGTSAWREKGEAVFGGGAAIPQFQPAVAAYLYRLTLRPKETATIRLVIGTTIRQDAASTAARLRADWRADVDAYRTYVERKALHDVKFTTGDAWLDRSAIWARALLATNAHYIDGVVEPMPCPAEYNFFFTHDVLLTNLAAVNFDPARVKQNLLFIASHARDSIIPHAYYWRDDGFKTEYCTPENWNHLWFVLVTASYLRHTGDLGTARQLYPLVTKSLHEILTQRKDDHLMYAYRPDWWDIGRNEGPRSYITILTIRALREYLYLSTALHESRPELLWMERESGAMETALGTRLWDPQIRYLINYNGEKEDRHIYAGSLLAAAYRELDSAKAAALIETAADSIVDDRIGVHTVTPPDFNTPQSIAFFKFVGNEAGDPYRYANGGIWSHTNAWYVMALRANGRTDPAFQFVRNVMTLDGVARSPMGIPAMYEYRYSDTTAKEYGAIDKPSFLWAGGFYLNVLYKLYGVTENPWNIAITPTLPSQRPSASYSLDFGGMKNVSVRGKGDKLHRFEADGKSIPSLVFPLSIRGAHNLSIDFGTIRDPYLEQVNAVLEHASYDRKTRTLSFALNAFPGHAITADVVGTQSPRRITIDGIDAAPRSVIAQRTDVVRLRIKVQSTGRTQTVNVIY